MGAKFFHADGHADKTKLTEAFRNFINAPTNEGKLDVGFKTEFGVRFCTQKDKEKQSPHSPHKRFS